MANADIQWIKATSKNGVPFEVGFRKTDDLTEVQRETLVKEEKQTQARAFQIKPLAANEVTVHWPVGNDTWKPTSGAVVETHGIVRYKLTRNTFNPLFEFTLDITSNHKGEVRFWDESGDHYGITRIISGNFSVSYNSTRPTIIAISN